MSDYQYAITRINLEEKLDAAVGHTLGEVDSAHVFDVTKTNPKVTGIAGDVIEQSVIGYPANSAQDPDLLVDGEEVELKTTGLRESKKMKGYEAKEPMSITAVSLGEIAQEDFEGSSFWHKVRSMLLVYYLYDSPTTVTAAEYARFPIRGYQFHRFTDEERETLRNDWQLVHDYVEEIQEEHPALEERERLYPTLSSALRDRLIMIDTAPKYPHPPRFRLKRSTVTAIARKHFGDSLVQLPRRYTSYAEIDAQLHEVARRFAGKSIGEMAARFGFNKVDKGVAEPLVCAMFGSGQKRMANIEVFAKAGIKAKSIALTRDGKRTEDMKLFTLDFDEFRDPGATFADSPVREYFAEGCIICIVLEEPSAEAPLADNVFKGFKRISFNDGFVDGEVRRTYDAIRDLVQNGKLRFVPETDKHGRPVVNKTGVVRGAPNFPKSAEYTVFVRGTGSNSTKKPECVNGIRMYRQQLWVKGSYIAHQLKRLPWI